jgi:hypothetical protein
MKTKVLLVGDYNRNDFLYVAKLLHSRIDFFFIEFMNQHFLNNKECLKYGQVIYWKDYKDAYDLLDKICPEKVVFYFIESFNHVALNVAAKVRGISTYHLEHGLRFKLEMSLIEKNRVERTLNRIKKIVQLPHLYDRYASRMFFQNTIRKSEEKEREFLLLFYSVRKKNSIQATFKKIKNPLRLPDCYISFSPLIFDYHKELESLPCNYPVHYIGIPNFDHFWNWKNLDSYGDNILFIDQPLFEKKLLGWSREIKKNFLEQLAAIIRSLGKRLYIKPHPWNEESIYEVVPEHVIVFEEIWETVARDINTVLGFSSTLLMPFMAMDHTACFTLEMHPQKGGSYYSGFLLESKACDQVTSFEDLKDKLINRDAWHRKQKAYKNAFIDKWMYKFDGKCSERLRKVLIEDEAV